MLTLIKEFKMSDPQKYSDERKEVDKEFAKDYDVSYEEFKIGVLFREGQDVQEPANQKRLLLFSEHLWGKCYINLILDGISCSG